MESVGPEVQKTHRLALATCAHLPGVHPDDVHLAASLSRLGIEPVACVWSDPAIDWSSFDAVLIRTTWDYFQRYEEFLSWLERLPVPTIRSEMPGSLGPASCHAVASPSTSL